MGAVRIILVMDKDFLLILPFPRGKLPPKLETLFSKIASVYCLALGARDTFFISYCGRDGLDHLSQSSKSREKFVLMNLTQPAGSDGLPEGLKTFVCEKDGSGN